MKRVGSFAILVLALISGSPSAMAQEGPQEESPANRTELVLAPGVEVLARYAYTVTRTDAGNPWFHEFDIPRAHLSLRADFGVAHARVLLEGARSATQGALFGVAGDSIVARFREAWAGADFAWNTIHARAGIVRTLALPVLESTWGLHAIAPSTLEERRFGFVSDLGATATWKLPNNLGWVGAGAYNGEGYTQRELNRGKNWEVATEIRPLAQVATLAPLALVASYVQGSVGVGSARANRLVTALLWRSPRLAGGVTFAYAWGVDDDGAARGHVTEFFARGEPIPDLLLGARLAWTDRNVDLGSDTLMTFVGTAGYRVATPIEIYAAVARSVPGALAATSLPDSNTWSISVVARATYGELTP